MLNFLSYPIKLYQVFIWGIRFVSRKKRSNLLKLKEIRIRKPKKLTKKNHFLFSDVKTLDRIVAIQTFNSIVSLFLLKKKCKANKRRLFKRIRMCHDSIYLCKNAYLR